MRGVRVARIVPDIRPDRPGVRPDRPGMRPDRPGVRPDRPGNRPSLPGTSLPGSRPDRPGARPDRPAVRPDRPAARPERPASRPSRPESRPERPAARPEARPQRPAARPPSLHPSPALDRSHGRADLNSARRYSGPPADRMCSALRPIDPDRSRGHGLRRNGRARKEGATCGDKQAHLAIGSQIQPVPTDVVTGDSVMARCGIRLLHPHHLSATG